VYFLELELESYFYHVFWWQLGKGRLGRIEVFKDLKQLIYITAVWYGVLYIFSTIATLGLRGFDPTFDVLAAVPGKLVGRTPETWLPERVEDGRRIAAHRIFRWAG